jgi:dethiobiotin synthetase
VTLVVVTGVGTEIGKTHVASALVSAWGRRESVLGYKPVESGVALGAGADEAALALHSTFHVKHPLLQVRLQAAVSPHLAARLEGRTIPLASVVAAVASLREETHVVLELPGGLFSPLSDTETNADLVHQVAPDVTLVVVPNRLGVLHDARALVEACLGRGLPLDGLVLSASARPDASSATNPAELSLTSGLPLLADLPRAPVDELVRSGALDGLVAYCRGRAAQAPSFK